MPSARGWVGLTVALAAGLLFLFAAVAPSTAQTAQRRAPTPSPVQSEGDDIIGRIRSDRDTLNSGSSGRSYTPPSCSWVDRDGEEHDDGVLRWRLTSLSQESWAEVLDEDVDEGVFYRYECWSPRMCRDYVEGGDNRDVDCFGDLVGYSGPDVDTFCGGPVCFFATSPENLALLALDEFVESLPSPVARFNPPDETTIVNFDTWLWVENAPPTGRIDFPAMEVPDQRVTSWATFEEVRWDMGDGSPDATFTCPLTTDAESAQQADCIYRYPRSSAGEGGDDRFHGTVSIVWQVEWESESSIAGDASDSFEELRESEFSIAVAEGQAVVVR